MKKHLTIESLINEAEKFCANNTGVYRPELFGVTDGKAVGTFVEHLFQQYLSDGRASLYLEFYLGRTETPVLDEDGNPVYYTDGAMKGKPKYKIKHDRRKENLNLYIWIAVSLRKA